MAARVGGYRHRLRHCAGVILTHSGCENLRVDERMVKRGLDIGMAGAGLLLTAPLQLGAAAAIRLTMGKPVLFRQRRPGLHGRVFEMVKFRTMHHTDDARGLVADADRLTSTGQFLRSTSIDELPTLWNVLRGDMSIVGPRPLLEEYLDLYTPEQARRHEVRPGLTGLAQVSGRNALSWEDRFGLDSEYVDNWSLRGDIAILLQTVVSVLKREGISAEGAATMPRFQGAAGHTTLVAQSPTKTTGALPAPPPTWPPGGRS